jgi:hypothetical protein
VAELDMLEETVEEVAVDEDEDVVVVCPVHSSGTADEST